MKNKTITDKRQQGKFLLKRFVRRLLLVLFGLPLLPIAFLLQIFTPPDTTVISLSDWWAVWKNNYKHA